MKTLGHFFASVIGWIVIFLGTILSVGFTILLCAMFTIMWVFGMKISIKRKNVQVGKLRWFTFIPTKR
jgi:uncharacterized membrane protein